MSRVTSILKHKHNNIHVIGLLFHIQLQQSSDAYFPRPIDGTNPITVLFQWVATLLMNIMLLVVDDLVKPHKSLRPRSTTSLPSSNIIQGAPVRARGKLRFPVKYTNF